MRWEERDGPHRINYSQLSFASSGLSSQTQSNSFDPEKDWRKEFEGTKLMGTEEEGKLKLFRVSSLPAAATAAQ